MPFDRTLENEAIVPKGSRDDNFNSQTQAQPISGLNNLISLPKWAKHPYKTVFGVPDHLQVLSNNMFVCQETSITPPMMSPLFDRWVHGQGQEIFPVPPLPIKEWKKSDVRSYFNLNLLITSMQDYATKSVRLADVEDFVFSITHLIQEPVTDETCRVIVQVWTDLILETLDNISPSSEIPELLWLSLNKDFLPNDLTVNDLATRAGITEQVARFALAALRTSVENASDSADPDSDNADQRIAYRLFGWIIAPKGRPGLVIFWDEVIPRIRMKPFWPNGARATVEWVSEDRKELALYVYPIEGDPLKRDPRTVLYTIQERETAGLDINDWVRYWEKLPQEASLPYNSPFVLPEVLISPFSAERAKFWNPRDLDDEV